MAPSALGIRAAVLLIRFGNLGVRSTEPPWAWQHPTGARARHPLLGHLYRRDRTLQAAIGNSRYPHMAIPQETQGDLMRTRLSGSLSFFLALVLLGSGAAYAQRPGGGGGGFKLPPLLMQTTAFPDGGIVPQKYAGVNGVQPGFKFSNAPESTVTYAIIFHDMDVAIGGGTDDVLHWIAWNIPASANGIPEGKLPEGSVTGKNLRGANAYMGPGAPPGPRYHHYVFE